MSEVTLTYPPPKLGMLADDITAFMNGRNKELVERAEKVLKKLQGSFRSPKEKERAK